MTVRWCALGQSADGRITALMLDPSGSELSRTELSPGQFPEFLRTTEAQHSPRWVWNDTTRWLPELLRRGLRVKRCHDLRLAHAILSRSKLVPNPQALRAATVGAAAALRRDDVGRIAVGQRADFALVDAPSWLHIPYRVGVPIVRALEV